MTGFATCNQISLRLVTAPAEPEQAEVPLRILTGDMRLGHDEAWLEFHRRYYLPLLRYAASRTACPHDAGDIIQQVYLRVARHIKPFEDEAALWRWLACLIRCVAVDHQRGVRRRMVLLEKFAHWQEANHAPRGENLVIPESVTEDALAKLPPEDAQLLRWKYCDGWSVRQIAADTDTTSKAVENRLGRLRERLRRIILRLE